MNKKFRNNKRKINKFYKGYKPKSRNMNNILKK